MSCISDTTCIISVITRLHTCTDLTSLVQPQTVSTMYSLPLVYIYVMPF